MSDCDEQKMQDHMSEPSPYEIIDALEMKVEELKAQNSMLQKDNERQVRVIAGFHKLEAQQQWRPIESAPKDEDEYILSINNHDDEPRIAWWDNDRGEWWVQGSSQSPNYWLPIPELPPKDEK